MDGATARDFFMRNPEVISDGVVNALYNDGGAISGAIAQVAP